MVVKTAAHADKLRSRASFTATPDKRSRATFTTSASELFNSASTFQCRGPGPPLAVGARNLGAECDEPFAVTFNDRCEFVSHFELRTRLASACAPALMILLIQLAAARTSLEAQPSLPVFARAVTLGEGLFDGAIDFRAFTG